MMQRWKDGKVERWIGDDRQYDREVGQPHSTSRLIRTEKAQG